MRLPFPSPARDRVRRNRRIPLTNRLRRYRRHQIGDWTYGKPMVGWADGGRLTIGKYCSFAHGSVILLGGEHDADAVSTYPFTEVFPPADRTRRAEPRTKGNVSIGHDVWVGLGAMIMSGVTIGDGAVIAARAVVVKDVPPYTVVGGVPAKPIRRRASEETARALQGIAWWDWPHSDVLARAADLQSADLDGFVAKYGVS
jgi:acetyltransferase-like isoleucine patch superfamily enzyme